MSKEGNTSTVTPRLRFPEFRGAEGWTSKPLSTAIRLISGLHLSPHQYYKSGTYPYFTGPSDFTNEIRDVQKWADDSTAIANRGDTLITVKGNGVGELWYLTLEAVTLGRQLMAIRTQNVSSLFVYQFLQTKRTRFEDLGSGNLIPGLSRGDILDLSVPFPPEPAEQQKIADCLTSLNEVIAAQGRKVAALAVHKRGLMQQLFPREGDSRPRLRFPEFRDAGEWKEKGLDTLAKRGTGHTPNKARPEFYNGGIKWVSLADSKRLDQGLISQTEIEISHEGIKKSSAVLHPAGTVLLSRDAGVGKSAIAAESMAVSQHFIVWICNQHELSNWFLYFVLQRLKPVFEQIATGSTIKTIGMPFFKNLRVTVPSIEEQWRIASCIISLEARIAAESEKLDSLKTHKKGLMQKLFPAAEGD